MHFPWLAYLATTALAFLGAPSTAQETSAYVGCYNYVPMHFQRSDIYQSVGYCRNTCFQLEHITMGLVNGTDCYCGDSLPPNDALVDGASCNNPCAGYPFQMCGGQNLWSVYQMTSESGGNAGQQGNDEF
ncbi:hypothetical protein BT63DRAFT_425962 [Microthyrium microscopicum]|uniref:WSC domain-containing protein n=1 Tax=Microthyrium microscopicum TaxID=703497 RepID=A0A6A6UB55_9PEZI|nr:hypothetical protein BT63DRAFT_425962 [Microthyrium microscopicum]